MSDALLASLDHERRSSGVPSSHGDTWREHAPDGSECRIVYAHVAECEVDAVIDREVSRAVAHGYTLEWKVYGHDTPSTLPERIVAAGFEAHAVENVLVLPLNDDALMPFVAPAYEVRRVHDEDGLNDVADISREIGRADVEEEQQRLAAILRDAPDDMSVHVAYVDDAPAACGRIHFNASSESAELAGGRTRSTHRHRGLFTALVGTRLREASARGRTHVWVDALPTSEPILRKRGFQFVTRTQPFTYEPAA